MFNELFDKYKLDEKSIIRQVINDTFFTLLIPIRITIWMLQSIVNRFLVSRLKNFLIKNDLIENLLNKNLGSLTSNNEYVHALNTIIVKQLEKVLDEMGKNYIDKVDPEAPDLKKDPHSNHQRKELTRLVTSLLEVLEEGKCLTAKQLDKYKHDKSHIQKILESLDSFLVPELVDSAVKLIKMTYDSFMNEEHLEEQLSNFLSLITESIRTDKKVTNEEFQKKEQEVSQLIDRILELTISDVIDKKFDFSIEKQKNQINHFIASLKQSIQEYENTISAMMDHLNRNLRSGNRAESLRIVNLIMKTSEASKTKLSNELHVLKGQKGFDSDVKEMLYDLSRTNADHYEELDKQIRRMMEILKSDDQNISRELQRDAMASLQKLRDWSNGPDLQKIEPIDFSISQMKPFKDYVARTAHSRVKERVDGLFEFIKEPINYRYGIAHHLLFLPFVQKQHLEA